MSALLGILLSVAAEPPAYVPAFDPSELKTAAPNEVLVLGTPHLSGFPEDFDASSLDPLLARLAAWKPEIITIEAIDGPECDLLRRFKTHYADAADGYCADPTAAQKALGLNMVGATAEIDRRLAAWAPEPTPSERRHLAALFLAGGQPASALVQWLRLPATERHAGDGLDDAMAAAIAKSATQHDEDNLVAAALAARLGLERVYPTDDHSADAVLATISGEPGFAEAMQRIWANPASARRSADDKALRAKLDGAGVLALYRAYNGADAARTVYASDFGAALADAAPPGYGRRYAGWWEVRNLRMVANIRATIAAHPGSRTLSIVGASHKGYFEAYLNMMHDIRLVDAEALLK